MINLIPNGADAVGSDPGSDNATGAAPGPLPSARPAGCAGFEPDGFWDSAAPSAALAAALEAASRAIGSHDQQVGVLRQWQALEAWAAAGKLQALRTLTAEGPVLPGASYRYGPSGGWPKSLTHEVALALSMPVVSAEHLMWFAHDLHTRFGGIGQLLADGDLTFAKARAVCEPLQLLSDEDAARAEALIVRELPGTTYGQAQKLAAQAALTVDPDIATRRRRDAEQHRSRIQLFREDSGAAGLSGRDLPTDQTLAAHASVCARASAYQQSGLFPAGTRMDQFRVTAYLDLLNGISTDTRLARARADGEPGPDGSGTEDGPGPDGPGSDSSGPDGSGPGPDEAGRGEPGPEDGPGADGPGSQGPDPDGPTPVPLLRPAELIIPLATLLGLGERPGEAHGLGPLDPGLCRQLATL
ncbi:MAG TPA: DUF222 domain-containing protein, partial [Trebonia sp.]|nr:DUF222 domain-containing protein [Trebonia sp.]